MSNHNFFLALIKVFGLYFFMQEALKVFSLWQFFAFESEFFYLMVMATTRLILLILLVLAIVHAELILNLLKLDKGFDTPILKNTHLTDENILELGAIFIGGTLIIHQLSVFINVGINIFQNSLHFTPTAEYTQSNFINACIEIGIGVLLISYRKNLAKFLVARETKALENEQ